MRTEGFKGALLSILVIAYLMMLALLILFTSPAFAGLDTSADSPSLGEDKISITLNFPAPQLTRVGGYHRVVMEGMEGFCNPGEPILPVRPVRMLIPFGTEVRGVRVSHGKVVTLDGSYYVEPAQKPVPLSSSGPVDPTPPNEKIYNSSSSFPAQIYSDYFIQLNQGYRILVLNLYPVSYVPAAGKISYFEDMRVEVELKPSLLGDLSVRGSSQNRHEIMRIVDNPETIDSYPQEHRLLEVENRYEYVIITSEDLKNYSGAYDWQTLCDRKESRGIATNIVTLDWIYANYGGVDDPEKIRNFIKDAYDNWSTEYVLLGGDDTVVPFRRFWVQAGGYTEDMPSDMYYSCLDGTFNYDGDDRWGEPNDGPGGGEVDLYAEVYVGRAPVASGTDVFNFVRKTLAFEDFVPEEKYLAYMVGEYLGFGGVADYAKAYKEEVRLGSDNHGYTTAGFASCDWVETDTLYEKDSSWSKYDLIDIIDNGVWVLNHLGHGSIDKAMKLYNSDLDSLTNTEYFFAYSQTCLAGHFDGTECWAEKAVRRGSGAAAVVMNARYGWGTQYSTDGPSQHFDREFWDAVFGENIYTMGWANSDSKEDQDWYISSSPYGRWCAYELNLFGDPELHFTTFLVAVGISPSESEGLPGTTLNYIVRVWSGNREDNYALTVSDVENWDLTLSENLLENMPPYETREVTLSVTIPDNVDPGTEDEITVIVTSQENAEISDNVICKARVPPSRRVEVSIVPSESFGCLDITFEVTVKNTGIENDNYDLSVDDNGDWGLRLSENLLRDMTYDENRTVTLTATIPDGTKPGTSDNITVTAISQGDPSVGDSASCLARVGTRVIEDNFEIYEVGEFPSARGWRTVWGGTDQNYVVDKVSVSGSKSFQLEGKPDWSAVIKRPFDWEEEPFIWEVGSRIGYEVYVRVEDISEKTSAHIGFFNETIQTWGKYYAIVGFGNNGTIWSGGEVLGYFNADTWYKIRVVLDTSTDLYDVWIDDELVGEDLETQDTHEIRSFYLASDHAGIKVYYDDVKVLSQFPIIDLKISPGYQSGLPGENLEYTVRVTNMSGNVDNFILENSDNRGWTLELENEVLEIPAFENRTTTLTVTIPENATPCTKNYVTIVATSQENSNISENDICIAHVGRLDVKVSISPPSQDNRPGGKLRYTVKVTNSGDVEDTYSLTVSDNTGWNPTLADNLVENVPPCDNRVVMLNVTIPDNAPIYMIDNITVVATSQENAEISDNASCIAHVISIRSVQVSVSPAENIGTPGEMLNYTVTVTNKGDVKDNFDLGVSDNVNWMLNISPISMQIDSGSSGDAMLTVTIPENAVPCTEDNITVTVVGSERPCVAVKETWVENPSTQQWYDENEILGVEDNNPAYFNIYNGWDDIGYIVVEFPVVYQGGAEVEVWELNGAGGNGPESWIFASTDAESWGERIDTWTPTAYAGAELSDYDNYKGSHTVRVGKSFRFLKLGFCAGGYSGNQPSPSNYYVGSILVRTRAENSCTAHAIAPWTGTAMFKLENLYAVRVNKNLDLNRGSKLVVKFYDYGDVYENENVIETFSTPPTWHVEENESARHPGVGGAWKGAKKVGLDLTYDNTENVISTIASYTVLRVDLETRFSKIPGEWFLAPPGSPERTELEIEFGRVPGAWFLAPS